MKLKLHQCESFAILKFPKSIYDALNDKQVKDGGRGKRNV